MDAYWIQYTAVGGETTFDFDFPIFGAGDLEVWRTPADGGTPVRLTLTTDYSVSFDDDDGSIALVTPAVAGQVWTLRRAVGLDRTTTYTPGGDFRAGAVNRDQDTQQQALQDLHDALLRAVTMRVDQPRAGFDPTLPPPVARRALMTNATADGFELSDHDPDPVVPLTQAAQAAAEAAQAAAEAAAGAAAGDSGTAAAAALAAAASALEAAGYAAGLSLPSGAGQAGRYLRQNAGETGLEYRTAAQVLADIAALALTGGTLTGNLTIQTANALLTITGTSLAILRMMDTGAAADARRFAAYSDGGVFGVRSETDTGAVLNQLLRLNPAGGVAIGNPTGGVPADGGNINATEFLNDGVNIDTLYAKLAGADFTGQVKATDFLVNNVSLGNGSKPCFAANKNGVDQSGIASATLTKITFANETIDQGSYFTASAWTPPAGRYFIVSQLYWVAGTVGGQEYYTYIYVGGSPVKVGRVTCPTNGYGMSSIVYSLVEVNGSQAIEIYGYGAGAGNKTVSGGADSTYFQGVRI